MQCYFLLLSDNKQYEQLITSSITIKEPSEFKQKVTVLVWYYMARIDFVSISFSQRAILMRNLAVT